MKICRNNWNSTHYISVGAREDFLVNGEQLLALDIRSSSSSLTGSGQWRNYEVPVTEVRVIPSSDASPARQCISDNTVITFDSLNYSHKHQGTYVLYRHKVLPYEVQVFYRRCNLRELCHCSVAVRVDDMIVTFDICSRGYMQVWIQGRNGDILDKNDLPDGIKLLSLDEGRSYEVCSQCKAGVK